MLITTTDNLQGLEIKEYIGLVYAIGQDFTTGMGKLADTLMEKTMEPLKKSLQAAGEKIGADAIIGVRIAFDKGKIKATGTAVKLK